MPPVNLERATEAIKRPGPASYSPEDWMIFFLKEDVTNYRMPGEHIRSYFRIATNMPRSAAGLHILGMGASPDRDLAMIFQTDCNYDLQDEPERVRHDCASVKGASGSLLGLMEEGEIRFAGVNTGSRGVGDGHVPGDTELFKPRWNDSVLAQSILSELIKDFFAFDVQRALKQAGCYSGKLDNQWGRPAVWPLQPSPSRSGSIFPESSLPKHRATLSKKRRPAERLANNHRVAASGQNAVHNSRGPFAQNASMSARFHPFGGLRPTRRLITLSRNKWVGTRGK